MSSDPPAPAAPGSAFLAHSAHLLERDLMPRIRAAVERLTPDDLWWRPNPASNPVGTLLLHMEGNLRQWVVSGLGGAPDVRRREVEFSAEASGTARELLAALEAAVSEAAAVLRRSDPAVLTEPRRIQGIEGTGLTVAYHAVEHLAMHTGQILWIVKARTGEGLGFYRARGNDVERTW